MIEAVATEHIRHAERPLLDAGVPLMAHTNGCGLVAHVEPFWGTDVANYLGSRRVMALPGEKLTIAVPKPGRR